MIFCLGEGKYENKGIGYQQNLMIFNKKVSEEVYNQTRSALNAKKFKLPIAKFTPEDEMFLYSLPNFDWDIFTKITGIKPEDRKNMQRSLSGKEVEVKLDGEVYKAIIQ